GAARVDKRNIATGGGGKRGGAAAGVAAVLKGPLRNPHFVRVDGIGVGGVGAEDEMAGWIGQEQGDASAQHVADMADAGAQDLFGAARDGELAAEGEERGR